MPISQVTWEAQDKSQGLTVADLHQFIQKVEEFQIDPRTPVKVLSGIRGQIKTISATGPA